MEPATIGFSIIGILQLVNTAYIGRINYKLDRKVDKELCDERRGSCSGQVKVDRESDTREMHTIERKIGRHTHSNGNGVKFFPEGH